MRRPAPLLKAVYLAAALNWAVSALVVSRAQAQSGLTGAGMPTVAGVVSLSGSYARPKPLSVFKNRAYCGESVPNETLLVGADNGLRNAAVLLYPLGFKPTAQPKTVVLDNQHCAFTPHVQIAAVGSDLLLKNSDPILHAVHARLGRETLFNVGLPKWRRIVKRLDRLGIIRIDCDVLHTWMSAAIVVTDTPFFAVTDAAGRFKIEGLPEGAYEMEVWHERLGSRTIPLAVTAGTTRVVDVVYSKQ